jgi:hypothetical protein
MFMGIFSYFHSSELSSGSEDRPDFRVMRKMNRREAGITMKKKTSISSIIWPNLVKVLCPIAYKYGKSSYTDENFCSRSERNVRRLIKLISRSFKRVQDDVSDDSVYLPVIEPAPKRQPNEATRPTYRVGTIKPSEFQKAIDLSG